ncbi:HepT-like ribonuclease domain-containing protein [Methanosarcina mazei]|nr:HepT-like ribonuclease domain-containing protein [Methanosarcina mazei]
MRDRLIHAYFNVDYDLVWDTAKNRVPMVERELEKLIEELSFSN